ncbi:hypothetical protein OAF17_03135, partial [Akkermansiaceae bacterium]|nr:hypothetical protein [Akkermansiaceae bacterium]
SQGFHQPLRSEKAGIHEEVYHFRRDRSFKAVKAIPALCLGDPDYFMKKIPLPIERTYRFYCQRTARRFSFFKFPPLFCHDFSAF